MKELVSTRKGNFLQSAIIFTFETSQKFLIIRKEEEGEGGGRAQTGLEGALRAPGVSARARSSQPALSALPQRTAPRIYRCKIPFE